MTDFKAIQTGFCQSIRGEAVQAHLALDESKTHLYQTLVRSNLSQLILPCFPILSSILGRKHWQAVINHFLGVWPIKSVIFHQLPKEFVHYLRDYPVENTPFAHDLAHYEWSELDVELSDCSNMGRAQNQIFPMEHAGRLCACARLLQYEYDVQNICTEYQPQEKTKSHLLLYKHNEKVQFLRLNELSYGLLLWMKEHTAPPNTFLSALFEAYPDLDRDELRLGCQQMVNTLMSDNALEMI